MRFIFSSVLGLCMGLCFFGSIGVIGTESHAQTLKEMLSKAYSHNPKIVSARFKLRGIDEGVSQAMSGWRPKVSIDANAGFSDIETISKLSTTSSSIKQSNALSPYSYSVSVLEPIYRGGRTIAETRSAEFLVRAARADLLVIEKNIFMSAIRAYLEVLSCQSELKLSINNEILVGRQFDAAMERFVVGVITQTEVEQARARFFEAKSQTVDAEGRLVSANVEYKYISGEPPKNLNWPESANNLPKNEKEAIDIALSNNPLIVKARFEEKSALEDVKISISHLKPEIALEARYSSQYETSNLIEQTDTASITANISIPIYQKGITYSRVRKSKLIAAQKRLDIEVARRDVVSDASKAWEDLVTHKSSIKALRAQVKASKMALDGIKEEGLVGLRSTLDILDAEQDLFVSRVNLVRARKHFLIASFWVKASVGSLTPSKLNLSVKQFRPEVYYNSIRKKVFGTGLE